jgi:multicomponent Na+:H+ antiporter subunit E
MHALILTVALAALWATLSAIWNDPILLGFGGFAVVLALVMTWRAGGLGFPAAPYGRLVQVVQLWIWLIPEIWTSALKVARKALAIDVRLNPHLIKLRVAEGSSTARATFANAITLTPGTITIDTGADHFIVHALDEADATMAGFNDMRERAMGAIDQRSAAETDAAARGEGV